MCHAGDLRRIEVCHPGNDMSHVTRSSDRWKSPATCAIKCAAIRLQQLVLDYATYSIHHSSRKYVPHGRTATIRSGRAVPRSPARTTCSRILVPTCPSGQVGLATPRNMRTVICQNSQWLYAPFTPLARRFRQHLHLCRVWTRHARAKLATCVHARVRGLCIAMEKQMGSRSDEPISLYQLLRRSLANPTVSAADKPPVLVRTTEEP